MQKKVTAAAKLGYFTWGSAHLGEYPFERKTCGVVLKSSVLSSLHSRRCGMINVAGGGTSLPIHSHVNRCLLHSPAYFQSQNNPLVIKTIACMEIERKWLIFFFFLICGEWFFIYF